MALRSTVRSTASFDGGFAFDGFAFDGLQGLCVRRLVAFDGFAFGGLQGLSTFTVDGLQGLVWLRSVFRSTTAR